MIIFYSSRYSRSTFCTLDTGLHDHRPEHFPQIPTMSTLVRALVSAAFFCHLSLGAPSVPQPLVPRQPRNCNTATDRACWISGSYDINTDYELHTPSTGNVRKVTVNLWLYQQHMLMFYLQYSLTLTEEENWVGPDGVTKEKVMLVNGKLVFLCYNGQLPLKEFTCR